MHATHSDIHNMCMWDDSCIKKLRTELELNILAFIRTVQDVRVIHHHSATSILSLNKLIFNFNLSSGTTKANTSTRGRRSSATFVHHSLVEVSRSVQLPASSVLGHGANHEQSVVVISANSELGRLDCHFSHQFCSTTTTKVDRQSRAQADAGHMVQVHFQRDQVPFAGERDEDCVRGENGRTVRLAACRWRP